MTRISLLVGLLLIAFAFGCSSSSVDDALDFLDDDILDIIDVPRRTIDTSRLGINAFANDGRFGSISSQYNEVSNTLRLKFVRILFGWDDAVQPTPDAAPNFSFYDNIMKGIPGNLDVLIVVRGVPSWMSDPANWTTGNPRTTFVERWVRPVIERYKNRKKIIGYQIWNEPNMNSNPDNVTLSMNNNPENYVEMLAAANSAMRDVVPNKLIVNATTTAINQNFPDSLNYNKRMKDAGAASFVDVWAIHYYGKQYENLVRDNGVADFLNGLDKLIWVTETGAQGVTKQLAYGEEVWPFLREKIRNLDRIYIYQFTEATNPASSYGLRTVNSEFPVSDMYTYLRDR